MNARTLQRIALSALVAALAVVLPTGCTPLRGARPTPTTPPATTAERPGDVAATGDIAGGTVVSAGGAPRPVPDQAVVQAQQPVAPMLPPDPLALPRPLPPTPAAPATPPPGVPLPVPNGQPFATPLPLPAPLPPGGRPVHPHGDPHVLAKPTAAGARLGLMPHEMPTDRVVELTIHLENLLAQNQALVNKVKALEASGVGREQALDEAARAIAIGNAEAERVRAALQTRVAALQSKIEQMEAEDIAVLKAVIAALERLVPPPPEKKP